ncbi:hypothetical protein GOV08_02255 [Candidatus Woesearchaeota archaeon]|nr:hypothetical protein [Candidatus Woesearchaeota archaeon]
MKILLYSFKDYKGWKRNITEKILKKVKKQKNLSKKVFLLRFEKKQYTDEVKKAMPDIIIGLGQHSKGNKIKIERKAFNFKKVNKKAKRVPINEKAPMAYFLSPNIGKDAESWNSYYIDDHVYNYSCFITRHYFKSIPFIFFNIPKKYDIKKAAKYVEKRIREIQKDTPEELVQKRLTRYVT